jgi:hypothetical protein
MIDNVSIKGLGVWFGGEHNYFHCPFVHCQVLVYHGVHYLIHLLQYHESSEPALFEALFGVAKSRWLLKLLEENARMSSSTGTKWLLSTAFTQWYHQRSRATDYPSLRDNSYQLKDVLLKDPLLSQPIMKPNLTNYSIEAGGVV